MMSFKIYVASHRDSATLADPNFVRVHVGAANTVDDLGEALRDDSGDNISDKNSTFCELTAMYWVWKNAPPTDYVGFCHYRRHFSFNARNHVAEDRWGVLNYARLDENYVDNCGLNSSSVQGTLRGVDVVLPKLWDVRKAGSKNMLDHFARGQHHSVEDYTKAVALVKKRHPRFKRYIDRVNESHEGHFTNMFVMKWPIFADYCEWLFGILFELEAQIDMSAYDESQRRIFGFLSEWLFNIYVQWLKDQSPQLKFIEICRTFLQNTDGVNDDPRLRTVSPAFHPSSRVAVVLAFDNGYAPYASALLASIRSTSSASRNYDIVVFSADINAPNKLRLRDMFAGLPNFSLRFVNVQSHFNAWKLPVYGQFSKETYYRLKIPDILVGYSRVVYLDADTIALNDIAELHDVDLGSKAAGATRDIVMSGFRKMKTPSSADTGGLAAHDYLVKHVKLKNPDGYFQAGVMVFDIEKLKTSDFGNRVASIIKDKSYWFLDQDILNLALQDDVQIIDGRWNALFGNGDFETFFAHLDQRDKREFFSDLRQAYVVHFAGDKKPWLRPDVSYNETFWKYSRQTPYYEELLQKLLELRRFVAPTVIPTRTRFWRKNVNHLRKKIGV